MLQLVQTGQYDLPGGTIIRNSTMSSAKTWTELMQVEQQEGRSREEVDKTDLRAFFTPVRAQSSTSNPPRTLSRRRQQETRTMMSSNAEARSEGSTEPLQNRFTSKYKNVMNSFKDDNKKEENPREALEDPDFDEYRDIE